MDPGICYKVKPWTPTGYGYTGQTQVQLTFSKAKRGDVGMFCHTGLGAWATLGLPQELWGHSWWFSGSLGLREGPGCFDQTGVADSLRPSG